MNIQLNYHHLRYFLAVADSGGIHAAAKALHVSAPTLSAQVKSLETFFNADLFHRRGRRLALTAKGALVQRYARRIVALGDELVEVTSRRGGVAETAFIGIADSVPKLLAARLLERVWKTLPTLRVVVREGLAGELFPALATHQIDLVLANEPPPESLRSVLFSSMEGKFRVRLAASANLCRRFRKSSGLDKFPILVPARESQLRRHLEEWWTRRGWTPDVRAEFDDTAAMYELAAAGVGAAAVVDVALKDVVQRYGLKALPCNVPVHEEFHVATAEREFLNAGPRVIASLAKELATEVYS